jgi:hypothetical protein
MALRLINPKALPHIARGLNWKGTKDTYHWYILPQPVHKKRAMCICFICASRRQLLCSLSWPDPAAQRIGASRRDQDDSDGRELHCVAMDGLDIPNHDD